MSTRIYLEHPVHGRKIAHFVAEAEADKKHGWVEYLPESPPTVPASPSRTFSAWFANVGGTARDKKLVIERYARENFGVEIDRRRTVKQLVAQLEALEADAGI